jgi:nucleotide-binding universal stress UspA family protein
VADAEGGAFELGTDGPKVILVGVDDSVTSMRAGAYAAGLARRQGARLVCVYVERPSAMYGAAAGAGASAIAAQEQALHETAADLRREAEEGARRLGLALTFVVARGDPYTELRRVADEVRADAVIVGASMQAGTGGSGRWRYGWSRPAGGRSPWSLRHCSADTDPRRSREAR